MDFNFQGTVLKSDAGALVFGSRSNEVLWYVSTFLKSFIIWTFWCENSFELGLNLDLIIDYIKCSMRF